MGTPTSARCKTFSSSPEEIDDDEASNKFIDITVTEPTKIGEGMSRYEVVVFWLKWSRIVIRYPRSRVRIPLEVYFTFTVECFAFATFSDPVYLKLPIKAKTNQAQ